MKKYILSLIICLLINFTARSQSTFQYYLPYSLSLGGLDQGINMILTPDSGCVISFNGNIFNYNTVGHMLKVDKFGSPQWGREYRSSDLLATNQIRKTNDGGYILCGTYETFNQVYFSPMIIKTDSLGNVLWKKIYGDSIVAHGGSFREMSNGDIVMIGDQSISPSSIYGGLILKTDSAGDTLWHKGITLSEGLTSLEIVENNNLLVCGYGSGSLTMQDIYLAKMGTNGDVLWQKKFTGSNDDMGIQVLLTKDQNYLLAANTWNASSSHDEILLMKLNQNGTVLWSKSYAGINNLLATGIVETGDSGFAVCGYGSEHNNTYDMFAMKTDDAGNLLWSKFIGGPAENEKGIEIAQNYDGGYFVCGGAGYLLDKIFLVSIDSSGNGNCANANATISVSNHTLPETSYTNAANTLPPFSINVPFISQNSLGVGKTPVCLFASLEETDAENKLSVFPNPTRGNISLQLNFTETVTAKLYSSSGLLVREWKNVDAGIQNFNLEGISQGIYIMKIVGEKRMYTAKFVVID